MVSSTMAGVIEMVISSSGTSGGHEATSPAGPYIRRAKREDQKAAVFCGSK
jgi:hypothetical protein